MKKFIVFYNSNTSAMAKMAESTPEEKTEGMNLWMAWKDSAGDKLVEFGSPLKPGQKLLAGQKEQASRNEINGYSIIQAENLDEAKSLLKNHPHLSWHEGCSIDVHEFGMM